MIERVLVPGNNVGTIICPTGSASAIVARAWVSVRADGGAVFDDSNGGGIWFQKSADQDGPPPGAGNPYKANLRSAQRGWSELPTGTEYLEYNIDAKGPGAIVVELQAR